MVQANDKPDKTHDRLTKELNKLKTDLNNEGNMDTDLSKRQLRSRSIVVPMPRVPTFGQMTTVDTTVPNPLPPIGQVQSSLRSNFPEEEETHKEIKDHRARITKSSKTNTKPKPPSYLSKCANMSWKPERTNLKERKIKINILTTHIHFQRQMSRTRMIET